MIHVEEFNGLSIVGGPEFQKLGDPYAFTTLAQIKEKDGVKSVYFTRMAGSFTKKDFNDIQQYFNSLGITDAHWIRIKKGRIKSVEIGDIMKSIAIISLILFLLIGTSCAYKTVAQKCSPADNGVDWVCEKSIWSK